MCVAPVTGLPEQGFFLACVSRATALKQVTRWQDRRAGGYCHSDERCLLASSVRQRVAVALGAVNGRGCRPVSLVKGGGMIHVAFLYGVCVSDTAKIVDQMFGKVKRIWLEGCDYFWCKTGRGCHAQRQESLFPYTKNNRTLV